MSSELDETEQRAVARALAASCVTFAEYGTAAGELELHHLGGDDLARIYAEVALEQEAAARDLAVTLGSYAKYQRATAGFRRVPAVSLSGIWSAAHPATDEHDVGS